MIQGGLPSVGDTVWVERTVPIVAGAVLRPQPWSLGALGQQLGPAVVQLESGGAVVRYPLVFWYAGDHQITMPGPVLVRRDGNSDTLAAAPVRVRVASVLPSGVPRTQLEPRPARASVPLEASTLLPLAVLVLAVLLVTGIVALRWRRKGRAPKPAAAVSGSPGFPTFEQWAASGEYRAALHELAWLLTDRMNRSRDPARTAELKSVLDEISVGGYSAGAEEDLAVLYQRASRLAAI